MFSYKNKIMIIIKEKDHEEHFYLAGIADLCRVSFWLIRCFTVCGQDIINQSHASSMGFIQRIEKSDCTSKTQIWATLSRSPSLLNSMDSSCKSWNLNKKKMFIIILNSKNCFPRVYHMGLWEHLMFSYVRAQLISNYKTLTNKIPISISRLFRSISRTWYKTQNCSKDIKTTVKIPWAQFFCFWLR